MILASQDLIFYHIHGWEEKSCDCFKTCFRNTGIVRPLAFIRIDWVEFV